MSENTPPPQDSAQKSARTAPTQPRIIGKHIRERRKSLGISQRALGQLFQPTVTTQFISNVERGVTPLPTVHIDTICDVLKIPKEEMQRLMEQEYAAKLSGRLGGLPTPPPSEPTPGSNSMNVRSQDLEFMKRVYSSYVQAGPETQQAFKKVCHTILNLPHDSE